MNPTLPPMSPAEARRKACIFCGTSLLSKKSKVHGKSDEHIVPKWLMKHLGIRETIITPMRMDTQTSRVIDAHRHPLSQFVSGRVCAKCNNGWMSELETATKPILKRLMDDPVQVAVLPSDERMSLARWSIKTVAVLNRASTYGNIADPDCRPVPDSHLQSVMSGTLPGSVVVVAGVYASQKAFDWLQFSTWAFPKSSVSLNAKDRNQSYKIGLGLRDLLLAVAYYPATDYRYAGIRGCHFPLWEGSREMLLMERPVTALPTVSSSPIIETFLRNIFIFSETWLSLASAIATTPLIFMP